MVIALILSGGTGSRLGSDIPKQYIEVNGKPVISYCIETLSRSNRIDALWIVASGEWQEQILEWLESSDVNNKFKGFSFPGENRQLSVFNGLQGMEEMCGEEDFVFVHDAARPLLTMEDIARYVDAAEGHDGAIPVLPMKDTVYLSKDGTAITSLLDRDQVFAGQAPEIFKIGKYIKANSSLITWVGNGDGNAPEISPVSAIFKINGSTEPAIMAGMDIVMIPGDEGNFKITTQADLARFAELVAARNREG